MSLEVEDVVLSLYCTTTRVGYAIFSNKCGKVVRTGSFAPQGSLNILELRIDDAIYRIGKLIESFKVTKVIVCEVLRPKAISAQLKLATMHGAVTFYLRAKGFWVEYVTANELYKSVFEKGYYCVNTVRTTLAGKYGFDASAAHKVETYSVGGLIYWLKQQNAFFKLPLFTYEKP